MAFDNDEQQSEHFKNFYNLHKFKIFSASSTTSNEILIVKESLSSGGVDLAKFDSNGNKIYESTFYNNININVTKRFRSCETIR